ncbi:MAG: hypothetical protein LBT94_05130 [Prevotellaceae bacterium]|jgi:hypothetical protein|nr:hypothetical protein [Prevotellaceae bacterium]
MKKIIKYCPDVGKYLVDVSKIVLGSVVISTIIKGNFSFCTDGKMVVAGIATSLFTVISGIILINVTK